MFKFLHLKKSETWLIPFTLIACSMFSFSLIFNNQIFKLMILPLSLFGIIYSTYEINKKYNYKKAILHSLNCIIVVAVTVFIFVLISSII
jgi:hypothetical protein